MYQMQKYNVVSMNCFCQWLSQVFILLMTAAS